MGGECQLTGPGLKGDQHIVGTDWRPPRSEVRANLASLPRVLPGRTQVGRSMTGTTARRVRLSRMLSPDAGTRRRRRDHAVPLERRYRARLRRRCGHAFVSSVCSTTGWTTSVTSTPTPTLAGTGRSAQAARLSSSTARNQPWRRSRARVSVASFSCAWGWMRRYDAPFPATNVQSVAASATFEHRFGGAERQEARAVCLRVLRNPDGEPAGASQAHRWRESRCKCHRGTRLRDARRVSQAVG
jgi:hypothetical protein